MKLSAAGWVLETLRPFAIVYARPERGILWRRVAHPATIDAAGVLVIELERTVPTEQADEDHAAQAERSWNNLVGRIAEELLAFTTGPYLIVDQIQWRECWRVHPDDVRDHGDFQHAKLELSYGQRRVGG